MPANVVVVAAAVAAVYVIGDCTVVVVVEVVILDVGDSYAGTVGFVVDVVVMDMGQIMFANRSNLAAADVAKAAKAPFGFINIPRTLIHTTKHCVF